VNKFQETIAVLNEAGVGFVVIGGVAITAHGSARITYDLDISYSRTRENIQRLVTALAPYHPRLRGAPDNLPFHFDAETVARGLNFTLETDLGDLDLLGEVVGIGMYPDVLASSVELEMFGYTCHVLSLEGLIRTKRAAGRPRDLAALPELEARREIEIGIAAASEQRKRGPEDAGRAEDEGDEAKE
jgi:predicted nucleotidyltransferase